MNAADDFIVPLTLVAEASSESSECRRWIVWTIRNRARDPRWPNSMAAVCMQPYQYSEFNRDRGDWANLHRALDVANAGSMEWIAAQADYHEAMGDIAAGESDPTNGSTHFYAEGITPPDWTAPPAIFRGQQGKVRFYSNVS